MSFPNATRNGLLPGAAEKYASNAGTCHKFARFMADLSRPATEGVYWAMAAGIVILAMCAAVVYTNTEKEYRAFKRDEALFKGRPKDPINEKYLRDSKEYDEKVKQHKKNAKWCLLKTSLLLIAAMACDVFQVFAIFTLQHCHHEDLLPLYWPIWTLLGLGSTIAMIGVCINQIYGLLEQDLPPFGTALGTPVLVVCAIGHLIYNWTEQKLRRSNVDSLKNTDSEKGGLRRSSTGSASCTSVLVSLKNGPVLQIWESAEACPPNATPIGKTLAGLIIFEHRCLSESPSRPCSSCSRRGSGTDAQVQMVATERV